MKSWIFLISKEKCILTDKLFWICRSGREILYGHKLLPWQEKMAEKLNEIEPIEESPIGVFESVIEVVTINVDYNALFCRHRHTTFNN